MRDDSTHRAHRPARTANNPEPGHRFAPYGGNETLAGRSQATFVRHLRCRIAGRGDQARALSRSREYITDRSEERRGGKECVSKCRTRWMPSVENKTTHNHKKTYAQKRE